jgi:hypothetical protein
MRSGRNSKTDADNITFKDPGRSQEVQINNE